MATISPMTCIENAEDHRSCPYDESHGIALKRMQFHLVKCQKAHPHVEKEVCPFNSTHRVNKQEYKHHLETCPEKGVLDLFKYYTPNNTHIIESLPPPELPPADENWDTDDCKTYDPAKKLANAPIVQSLIGGTKSQKKKSRNEQRQKFRALDDSVQLSKGLPISEVNTKNKSLSEDQPLRHPKTVPKALSTTVQYATLAPEVVVDGVRAPASTPALTKTKPAKAELPSKDQPLRQPKTLSKALSTSAQLASLNNSSASLAGDAVNFNLQPGDYLSVTPALEKGHGKSLSKMRPAEKLTQHKAGVDKTKYDFTTFATSGRGKFVF